eukprot:TRINITY_DN18893_c0_g4_i1.p1 TRINITY_DN18893_c0_g4~~TRINITY_DN18893_c0_g4_i1.p1  ORF type:complete len:216 (+),score=34.11 TRINITY_DN18893_c0_g4_i1:53-649(+)
MEWFDGGYQRKLDELVGGALQRHNDANRHNEADQLDLPWVIDKEPAVWEGLPIGEKVVDRNVKAHWQSSKEMCPAKRALQMEIERQKKASSARREEKKRKEEIWGKVLANKTNDPGIDHDAVKRRLSSRKGSFAPSLTPSDSENYQPTNSTYSSRRNSSNQVAATPAWLRQSGASRFQPGTTHEANTNLPLPAWMQTG